MKDHIRQAYGCLRTVCSADRIYYTLWILFWFCMIFRPWS